MGLSGKRFYLRLIKKHNLYKATATGMLWCCLVSLTLGQSTERYYLSGTDKDHTVQWDFYVTHGRHRGEWSSIPVPSQWELQGFGTYHYGGEELVDEPDFEDGHYRYQFKIPETWRSNKNIFLVFEGSMTDTEVKLNGKSAGRTHQGGFYRFKYDVTDLVKFNGKNLLQATVSKISEDTSVNRAERQSDYWVFGGIYRPVYLEAFPEEYISRVAIDARANGNFKMEAYLSEIENTDKISAQIYTLDGKPVGKPFSADITRGDEKATLHQTVDNYKTWTTEFPNRYKVNVQLWSDGKIIHMVTQKFGFRTIVIKPGDGIYVNGQRVMLKGASRHSFWPESGRTTSKTVSLRDVDVIKDMNMNAVRMSHYPPDQHFLDVCDSLGLFVLDELGGWQTSYDTEIGEKLVKEMVIRDVNHPSILFWDNGNEGGWNTNLDDDFAKYDPQNRPVLHPWEVMSHIDTDHYENYASIKAKLQTDTLFMPTEFLHGLYDGGHGAGLKEYWTMMRKSPVGAGGFLWSLIDEGVVRTDQGGAIDVHGNNAPDGILGPYREKEASYYAIKKIWAPIYIKKPKINRAFKGHLSIENRYYYTNLRQCSFTLKVVDFPGPFDQTTGHKVIDQVNVGSPSLDPQTEGSLQLSLPADWHRHDALYLTAKNPLGREVYTWTWMIEEPDKARADIVKNGSDATQGRESHDNIILTGGDTKVMIDKRSGLIRKVTQNGKPFSFNNGPRWIENSPKVKTIAHRKQSDHYIVDVKYEDDSRSIKWTMMGGSWLKLDYSYNLTAATADTGYSGISFNYPEKKITDVTWLGKGPYRVWKNRMAGATYNVWEKAYNDTKTGQEWVYPEFKGNHANMYWAKLKTDEGPITFVTDTPNLFFRLLTPTYGVDPRNTKVEFPIGDISFLNSIKPIGTKFIPAEKLTSQKIKYDSDSHEINATIYFFFGEM